jgi:phenylalanyl-tRNA synthetase beta chain
MKEGGKVDNRDDFLEAEKLLIVLTGQKSPSSFDTTPSPVDIFDVKGDVEALLKRLHIDKYRFIPYDADNTLTEQELSVDINGKPAGWLGKVRSTIAKKFDIDIPVFVGEISVAKVGSGLEQSRQYTVLPKYPSVQRDLAFVVDAAVAHEALEATIRDAAGPLLESVTLFDIYAGAQIGSGKRSLAYGLVFRSQDGTLTDAKVDPVIRSIIQRAAKTHMAELRT